MARSYDIPLHDIKPLMEVPDSSFALFLFTVTVITFLLLGALYLLYRFIKSRKEVDPRKVHYRILESVDLDDAKKAAYTITEYGRIFADDSQRLHEAYDNLVARLEAYKYRKQVSSIDDESRNYYKIYLGMIDV